MGILFNRLSYIPLYGECPHYTRSGRGEELYINIQPTNIIVYNDYPKRGLFSHKMAYVK